MFFIWNATPKEIIISHIININIIIKFIVL